MAEEIKKEEEKQSEFHQKVIYAQNENESAQAFFERIRKGIELQNEFDINKEKTDLSSLDIPNISKDESKMEESAKDEKKVTPSADDIFADRKEETLKLLVDAAIKKYHDNNNNKDKIQEINNRLPQLEEQRKSTVDQLKLESEKDLAVLNTKIDTIVKAKKQMFQTWNQEIDTLRNKITEDEKDREEQKILRQAELDELEKVSAEYISLRNDPNASIKAQLKLEEKKEKIEKWVEAFNEYLEFIDREIEERNARISDLETKKQQLNASNKKEIDALFEEFSEKYGSLDDNKQINIEAHPTVQLYTTEIENLKAQQHFLEKNPEEIYNNIVEMMNQQEPPEKVEEEIRDLASLLESEEVIGVLPWLGVKHEKLLSDIEALKQEKNLVQIKLAGEPDNKYINYIKQEEKIKDQEEIDLYTKQNEEYEKEIASLTEERNQLQKQKILPSLKNRVRSIDRQIKQKEKELKLTRSEDEKVIIEETISSLNTQKQINLKKIEQLEAKKVKKLDYQLKREIEELHILIEENLNSINILENKTDEEYIDIEAREKDAKFILIAEKQIKNEEKQQIALENHKSETLIDLIMDDYKKSLKVVNHAKEIDEEELEDYEEAPKGLIDKIKSSSFKKKMAIALATIATVAITVLGITQLGKNKNETTIEPPITIETTDEETVVEEEKETKEVAIEEKKETEIEESSIEQALEDALQDMVSGSVVYESADDAINETDEKKVIDYVDLWKEAQPGKFYIMLDGKPLELNSLDDAEDYYRQGYEVAASVQNDDGTLGFLQVELPKEEVTKSEGRKM